MGRIDPLPQGLNAVGIQELVGVQPVGEDQNPDVQFQRDQGLYAAVGGPLAAAYRP